VGDCPGEGVVSRRCGQWGRGRLCGKWVASQSQLFPGGGKRARLNEQCLSGEQENSDGHNEQSLQGGGGSATHCFIFHGHFLLTQNHLGLIPADLCICLMGPCCLPCEGRKQVWPCHHRASRDNTVADPWRSLAFQMTPVATAQDVTFLLSQCHF
jgi:hypothetical protein